MLLSITNYIQGKFKYGLQPPSRARTSCGDSRRLGEVRDCNFHYHVAKPYNCWELFLVFSEYTTERVVEIKGKVVMELNDEVFKAMEVGLEFRDYNGRINSMDFHRKATNYMVTASDSESIRLYDIQKAMCLKTISSKKYGVDLVNFTHNPSVVLYSSRNGWDESLRLLSLNDNKYLRYFTGHQARVVSMSLCPTNDFYISGSLDRNVLFWDQRAEKPQGLLRVQGRPAVSYDEQGCVFAIAFNGAVRLFDARNYGEGPFGVYTVDRLDSEANVVKFSNDGHRMLLTTSEGHIHVFNSFNGGTMINTFNVKPANGGSTLEASFSPDGNYVVSGSGDGSVYAWNIRTGEVAYWGSTDEDPPSIKWVPNSLSFVSGSSELSFWVPDLSKLSSFIGYR